MDRLPGSHSWPAVAVLSRPAPVHLLHCPQQEHRLREHPRGPPAVRRARCPAGQAEGHQPDIKDVLREPNDANNPKFIILHTEYTHEGDRKKGAKDDTKKGGWNSSDKKSMTKDEALANSPVVLEQWIINVQKVAAHDVHGLTPFLKLEKAFIKLPDGSGSGGDATQSMLDAID